jgi:hypothetical protein
VQPVRRRWVLALLLFVSLAVPGCTPIGTDIPGDFLGEIRGNLARLALDREDLTIDLRPVRDYLPALVEATYAVRNDGAETDLEFHLVPGAATRSGSSVLLDGRPVAGRKPTMGLWPDGFDLKQAPAFDVWDRGNPDRGLIAFPMTLTPGPHIIKVRYQARARGYEGDDQPTTHWFASYLLLPARWWARFGTLTVTVLAPEGWDVDSRPSLNRQGGTSELSHYAGRSGLAR